MTSIAIIAFDGVTDIDVFLHWDFLNRPLTMFGEALAGYGELQLEALRAAPLAS